ncbi:MAG: response regulator transcription factor [Bacteroidales bacterium]
MVNIEFYSFENEVWYRQENGLTEKLTEKSRDIVKFMIEQIQTFYPKAYKELYKRYEKLSWNIKLQEFRIVNQFCRCNFGNIDIDNLDIDFKGFFEFENIPCPLRGECQMENIVCKPEFNSCLSEGEMRIARLVHRGKTNEEIANTLFISLHTVKNHMKNIFKKLNISNRVELVEYCNKINLFKH